MAVGQAEQLAQPAQRDALELVVGLQPVALRPRDRGAESGDGGHDGGGGGDPAAEAAGADAQPVGG